MANFRYRWRIGVLVSAFLVLLLSVNMHNLFAKETKSNTKFGPSSGMEDAHSLLAEGKNIFRFDTFGDEDFWGGKLRLHESVEKISPKQAIGLGLKVDLDALPTSIVDGLKSGKINLDDPAITLTLIKLNTVVGVKGVFKGDKMTSIGFSCALCHSTVDDALAPGIGKRMDGWPNQDLNVGAIVATAPDLTPYTSTLGVDDATVRKVLNSWGPGMYDAELNIDGKAFTLNGKSAATRIPAAFGLAGVNLHTWTGSWGTVSYWNAYVANLQMHGKGTFVDARLDNAKQYPVAAKFGLGHKHDEVDLITDKLPALHFYQLSLLAPKPPVGSYDAKAAVRGKVLFASKAACINCHVPPIFTEPGWNLHTAEEIGIDSFQSDRSPDHRYRTAPLAGLWAHSKRGFYHDGRFATLKDVVEHYNTTFKLNLLVSEKLDLVEYMKSLPQ